MTLAAATFVLMMTVIFAGGQHAYTRGPYESEQACAQAAQEEVGTQKIIYPDATVNWACRPR
jgi:hypothetical protein